MSQTYYRVKKYRKLKKLNSSKQCNKIENYKEKSDSEIIRSDDIENNFHEVISDIGVKTSIRINVEEDDSEQDFNIHNVNNFFQTNDIDVLSSDEVNSGIMEKIRQWTLNNLDSLRLNVVTDLLRILRSEGHSSLPKTCQTLLGTKHYRKLQQMQSSKNSPGEYFFIGIEHGLHRIINPNTFIEEEISVLVHIDGIQIFNNSQIQAWPIIMKIFHEH